MPALIKNHFGFLLRADLKCGVLISFELVIASSKSARRNAKINAFVTSPLRPEKEADHKDEANFCAKCPPHASRLHEHRLEELVVPVLELAHGRVDLVGDDPVAEAVQLLEVGQQPPAERSWRSLGFAALWLNVKGLQFQATKKLVKK